jgi:hypothetical protein
VKTGACIKFQGSGFKNPDLYPFTLHSIWLTDLDLVRIRFYLHLHFRSILDRSGFPRIRTPFRVSFSGFSKFLGRLNNSCIFRKFLDFSNGTVRGLKDEMQIQTHGSDRHVRRRPGTVKIRDENLQFHSKITAPLSKSITKYSAGVKRSYLKKLFNWGVHRASSA